MLLRVTIEFIPKGDEKHKSVVAVGTIVNDLTTPDAITGDYSFVLETPENHVWRTGRVKGWDRLTKNTWELLHQCLKEVV